MGQDGGRKVSLRKGRGGEIQLASSPAEVEEKTTTTTMTTHADLCQNETDLFVETRRETQTSDRRHAEAVTQMGKSVFSKHMHAPTKTRAHTNRRAMLSPLDSSDTAISRMSLI